ncbi:hypothetical protein DSCO28_53400 [Desulfosarcina ovata subsp. sediminis]|uniref:Uncharacterized protein n=1 Tax=Desulfosarcina ovata subsp. sediminis TaxID=885957 RepID=A0A5K7ZX65_9BACT|nr:hypothetical protein DSCO28_53400 [Desulfosarcina ovata subsp. sediminis]
MGVKGRQINRFVDRNGAHTGNALARLGTGRRTAGKKKRPHTFFGTIGFDRKQKKLPEPTGFEELYHKSTPIVR